MAYDKGGAPGPFMNSGKGMCSHSDGKTGMAMPRQVSRVCGPGMNSDQAHANKLLQKAIKEKESLRGKSGM
tara:strand:- start:3849 stop:4061 length:213 start_codon:yes stop_codon:yes gene_type:complete